MTELYAWISPDAGRDLGWTLVHFVWQGALLAALLQAVLPLCRHAAERHNCALAILAAMALAPVATFVSIHEFARDGVGIPSASTPMEATAWTNWLVILWLGGIAVLSLRTMGGLYLARSLGRRDTLDVPAWFLARCRQLEQRIAPLTPVGFLLSRRINAPMVVGWFKPVVLIPLSMLAGLTPAQLEALILHELAHIRRFDAFINILLTAIETVLFYHPAVWWVGRQVRTERENCCDDLAVSACGNAELYVEALAALKPWDRMGGAIALGANDGKLKERVARLLDRNREIRRTPLSAVAGLALLGLLAGTVALAHGQLAAHAANAATYPSSDRHPVTLRPIQETHTLPPYPRESIHQKEQGRVKLSVTIGTDGAISHATVVEPSGHPRLDETALQFVKSHWRWYPAMRAGKPVVVTTRVSVLFDLKPAQPKPAP